MDQIVPIERVEQKIYVIRGQKVMLDRDLAELYGVPTKVLNQAVRRNLGRFPEDFMLILSEAEVKSLRSQFVTLDGMNWSQFVTSSRNRPKSAQFLAFTERGVAMLSSVLKSEQAILMNIQIIRAFGRMREMIAGYEELRLKVEAMEKEYGDHFRTLFDAMQRLLAEPESGKDEIGFQPGSD